MKNLIIHLDHSFDIDNDQFCSLNIKPLYQKQPENELEKQLYIISSKDFLPYLIHREIIKKSIKSIILVQKGIEWYDLIRIGIYIRLSPIDSNVSKLPIIFCYDKPPDLLNDENFRFVKDIVNFQFAKGFFFRHFSEVFKKQYNEEGTEEYGIEFIIRQLTELEQYDGSEIEISSKDLASDRHSITNQWGAVKLALNCGYKPEDIDYNFPPTLYFNSLIKKYKANNLEENERKEILDKLSITEIPHSQIEFSKINGADKILLVDDNADIGWASVLKRIFGNVDVHTDFEKVNQFGKLINLSNYSLIFLDLRLPKILKKEIKPDFGFKLLEIIKKNYPEIPVIIFTASNKSWTLHEVIELGADGMYVKESPEYAHDKDYSKGNFENFIRVVYSTLSKYQTLRPYWESIQKILNSPHFISIREIGNSKLKARIKERLEMFYGLLKRGFEQTKYNQGRFHFSENALAYLTLWSILNEISEAFFEKNNKTFPILSLNSPDITTHHPKGSSFNTIRGTFETWKIVRSTNYFIDYFTKKDTHGDLICLPGGYVQLFCCSDFEQVFNTTPPRSEIPPYFRTLPNPFELDLNMHKIYKQKLSLQIAYLIEKSPHTNKQEIFQNLIRLNQLRNNLFLTHGSEIALGFYNQTEKDKQIASSITPDKDIKDLFNIVAFLLSNDQTINISF